MRKPLLTGEDLERLKIVLETKRDLIDIIAEVTFKDTLPNRKIDDHKLCICGDILKGKAKPYDCTIFGKACKPNSPVW